jgi:general secretion pathway protein C
MLDTRTNAWLSGLQANGPKLVAGVLGALIVLELGRLAYSMYATPVKSPQPVVAATNRPQRPALDIQSVVSAHLFGVAAAGPGSSDPTDAPQSSANLVLAGTIATQDPKRGVAIVSDGGAPSKVYSVGDRIGGAALHSVYLDRVILDRNGALETLLLPRQLLPGARGPAPVRPVANATVAAVENIRHAINGTALDDPQRSQEVFDTIQTSDHVTVTIERGGQKQDITLNIAQVAAQATKDLESGNDPNAAAPDAQAPARGAPSPQTTPNNNNENATD